MEQKWDRAVKAIVNELEGSVQHIITGIRKKGVNRLHSACPLHRTN